MVKDQNFIKLFKMCLDIDQKIIFFQNIRFLCQKLCRPIVGEKSMQSSNMALNSSKMEIFNFFIFFLITFFALSMSYAKNVVCRSNGVTFG